jgi:predicted CXXCH cytochrome family protein
VKRLALLMAVGATWLFLAAVPALADGGPHVANKNSGTSTLTADSCAGCHRAHTGQGSMIINAPTEELLCVSCHGDAGNGATTNVERGVQYAIGANGLRDTGEAGALRAGGFEFARIGSSGPLTRTPYPRDGGFTAAGVQVAVSFSELVPAKATGSAVTSTHMHLAGTTPVTGPGIAWGNGAIDTGAGPTVTMECVSCHNVHGNNQYRILNPVPDPASVPGETFTPVASDKLIADVRPNPTGALGAGVRNYTVKWGATLADVVNGTFPNPDSTTGDYWRRLQPASIIPTWDGVPDDPAHPIINPSGGNMGTNYYRGDMPEFVPTGADLPAGYTASGPSTTWRSAMSDWCAACHSRYHTATTAVLPGAPNNGLNQTYDTGDDVFRYRHGTTNSECTQCHVAHGSNAVMDSDPTSSGLQGESANFPWPGSNGDSASSRLLKIDNRGTCTACHDPTDTVPYTGVVSNP